MASNNEKGLEMLNLQQEQLEKELRDLNAADSIVVLQMIERMTQIGGAIRSTELATIGIVRNRFAVALEKATGINYDEVVAAQIAAAQRAAMAEETQDAQPVAAPAS